MGGGGGCRVVKMNLPIVEIDPVIAVLIPLDFLSLVGPSSFEYVDTLEVFFVRKTFPDDFWVEYGVVVKRSPGASNALGI